MKLLQPDLAQSLALAVRHRTTYARTYGNVDSLPDFRVAAHIAADAQTILFDSDQALALRPALERFAEEVDYRLPFANVILQFTQPIPETVFFAEERPLAEIVGQQIPDTAGDTVLCLLLHQHTDNGETVNQAVAYFHSTAVNRVMWAGDSLRYYPDADPSDLSRANKERLRALAVACIAYINCINLMLERHEPDERVNRKRAAKGKRVLQPYYTVVVRPEYRQEGDGAGGQGSKHGHRYDVRGHFRRAGERLTWVRPHQRGLSHTEYIPAVRRVGKEEQL